MSKVVVFTFIFLLISGGVLAASSFFKESSEKSFNKFTPTPDTEPTNVINNISDSESDKDERVKIFFVKIGDDGDSGKKIGCGDSLVGIEEVISQTSTPLVSTLQKLLSIEERTVESDLYNSLADSDLRVENVFIENDTAKIMLTGKLTVGGVCDTPRVSEQLSQTVLQFPNIEKVEISVNGVSLDDILSGR